MDLSKLTTNHKLMAGGSIAAIISAFLPWYGVGGFSFNGSDYLLTGVLPLLLSIALLALVYLRTQKPETSLPEIPVSWAQAQLGLAGATAVLILLRLLTGQGQGAPSGTLDRQYGLFLAAIAAIAMAAGAFLNMQEEGDSAEAAPTMDGEPDNSTE